MKKCQTCNKNLWAYNKTGFCVPCLGKQRTGTNNHFAGKHHSVDSIQKMCAPRPQIEGKKNPHYGKRHSAETKKIIGDKARQRYKDRPELLEQLRMNGAKALTNSFRITKPQRLVQKKLDELNFTYVLNGLLERYSFDFILKQERIIIEVHGTYWHADPRVYGPNKIPYTERQLFKIEQDIKKKLVVETHGYKLLVIWEDDIKHADFSAIEELWKEKT